MPASIGPNLSLNYAWALGENFKSGMDANLLALDTLVHLGVISMSLTAPPGSPAEGDRYIVAATATGAWAGHENDIAAYLAGAWYFYTPQIGWTAYVAGDGRYDYDGTEWTSAVAGGGSQPFDLTAFYPGVPSASAIVTRVPVARVITFSTAGTTARGTATVAATAQTDFDVQLNGVSAGTIRFAAGATTCSFIAASPIVTAAGDVISIHAPATPDATLANVGIVLSGTR